jgi:hypothetical protein
MIRRRRFLWFLPLVKPLPFMDINPRTPPLGTAAYIEYAPGLKKFPPLPT